MLRRNVINPGSVTPAAAAARRTLLAGTAARSDAHASPKHARQGSGPLAAAERRGSAKIGAVPGREGTRRGSSASAGALDGAIAVELVAGAKRPAYPSPGGPEGKDGVSGSNRGNGRLQDAGPPSPGGESDAASAAAPQGFRVRDNPLSGSGPKTPASAFAAAAISHGGDAERDAGRDAAGKAEDAGLGQGLAWDEEDGDAAADAAEDANLLAPQVLVKNRVCLCSYVFVPTCSVWSVKASAPAWRA